VNDTSALIHFEDLVVGEIHRLGSYTVTREEIIDFARKFDPQPFHLDDEAGRASLFGGLCASGWHTSSICMRLLVDGYVTRAATLGSPGVDELRWLRPVFPGDVLSLRIEVTEKTPSRSKPDRGSAKFRYELTNQRDEIVLRMIGIGMVRRRTP
jgi:acyl dehydratase